MRFSFAVILSVVAASSMTSFAAPLESQLETRRLSFGKPRPKSISHPKPEPEPITPPKPVSPPKPPPADPKPKPPAAAPKPPPADPKPKPPAAAPKPPPAAAPKPPPADPKPNPPAAAPKPPPADPKPKPPPANPLQKPPPPTLQGGGHLGSGTPGPGTNPGGGNAPANAPKPPTPDGGASGNPPGQPDNNPTPVQNTPTGTGRDWLSLGATAANLGLDGFNAYNQWQMASQNGALATAEISQISVQNSVLTATPTTPPQSVAAGATPTAAPGAGQKRAFDARDLAKLDARRIIEEILARS
ncbi:hypothetical protein K474DRAFT_976723 [Panus rudis PR-1116 ss-1]|nr:hypothetical protein K474DRAFT_976723 [Panus rudis PR-1116 ss-1]